MTNHWNDIDNASLVLVFGANPAENHPACMAHVNAARYGSKNAKMVVIDPRKTRTALQCDATKGEFFVRIRPGTDIAFINGLLRYIMNNTAYNATAVANMMAWHNGTNANFVASRNFIDDGGTSRALSVAELGATTSYDGTATTVLATGYPKYCDTRIRVNAAGDDYMRGTLTTKSYTSGSNYKFSNFPVFAASVTSASDTVWQKLKLHVAPYTESTVEAICGCAVGDIAKVAKILIDHSRFNSSDFSAATATPTASSYRATTILYAMGQTQHTCGAQNIKGLAVLQTLLGNMGRAGGGINALRGIHNVQGSTDMGNLFDSIPAYSGNPGVGTSYVNYMNPLFGNRMTNPAVAASLLVNCTNALSDITYTAVTAGTAGNSITVAYEAGVGNGVALSAALAVDAITVTLGTDGTGALDPTKNTAALVKAAVDGVAAAKVTTTLEGDGSGAVEVKAATNLTGGVDADSRVNNTAVMGLQQRGFHNMTTEWFGNAASSGADVAKLYDAWPKGNGFQHIEAIRRMSDSTEASRIKAAVVWGQNPCVTEPNQSAVRAGFKNLDLLVVVDMFETETAACDRKVGGHTYLIPACAHTEEAGSVTNSGRWIQWRERAAAPKGNSKADLELLLRFAYALDKAGCFSHLTDVAYNGLPAAVPTAGLWSALGTKINGPAYTNLYARNYGWTPDGTPGSFEALSATSEKWAVGATAATTATVKGSEVVAENVYKEMTRPLNYLADGTSSATTGGTMWIYSGAGTAAPGPDTTGIAGYNGGTAYNANAYPATGFSAWTVKNRAKSRDRSAAGGANTYSRWGWAWLLNRRVFYNNSEVPNDQADNFVSPHYLSALFTQNTNTLADWSTAYRAFKTFKDKPSAVEATHADYNVNSPHFMDPGVGSLSYAGRFPGHTEPYESPASAAIKTAWGKNTSAGSPLITTAAWGTVPATAVGTYGTGPAEYNLVLTTIRCVEHFQGGPITRNNAWNVEAEPEPWIEINSVDAAAAGITNGMWVNVTTARGNSQASQEALCQNPVTRASGSYSRNSANPTDNFGRGFRARVGTGLTTSQRVAPGVVAIPWHWGDRGLSTGARANDLCIDAWDANTMIPEYKACLCKIAPATTV